MSVEAEHPGRAAHRHYNKTVVTSTFRTKGYALRLKFFKFEHLLYFTWHCACRVQMRELNKKEAKLYGNDQPQHKNNIVSNKCCLLFLYLQGADARAQQEGG